ncbi:MAG: hypothetical protein OJF50_000360 [Nitrospira sp.]|jgi:transposase InsO family protein|uniref:Integrase catalytic domain-containing protein n=1 Tax=Nitrospira moscoviensis TaxID=42253 RepID=A0A0K2GAS5_NITMO|nr:hypothetical protein NITMOv2_1621 [Nitrospira moscoviensis]MDI3461539.1 hypothetical protein [Nitrospira sp.]
MNSLWPLFRLYYGSEFASKALDAWAYAHGVKPDFIRPGKPVENAVIESFNGRFRFRDGCLNANVFISLHGARQKIDAWRIDYNEYRPHGSLGDPSLPDKRSNLGCRKPRISKSPWSSFPGGLRGTEFPASGGLVWGRVKEAVCPS